MASHRKEVGWEGGLGWDFQEEMKRKNQRKQRAGELLTLGKGKEGEN